ncbi:MAG: S24 family peptidase [Oscillospiraceae bacterium]|nr:S24 family peptidase [Oscillospiraceae bacterium]
MSDPIFYDRKIFAANLRRLMDENRERQADIARLLDVSKSTVSAYCGGEQMPRMDKIEQLAHHYRVPRSALIESAAAAPARREPGSPVLPVYNALNESGQSELVRYGRYLAQQPEYKAAQPQGRVEYIKHYLVPAAAGYASPIEGEDFELVPKTADTPLGADFCISIAGDSMEPYIHDGSLVYVRRDTPLREFDVGVFFVDGDVFCKQWCVDYVGTLHLLSANPARRDANIAIARDSGRSCVCFGKVLLPERLPQPSYR